MAVASAFACIRCHGVLVRAVELTPEVKRCLSFLRFAGLGHEPLDSTELQQVCTDRGTEQHFHLAYTASASIALPSLAVLRYALGSGVDGSAIYLQAFGVCVEEPIEKTNRAEATNVGAYRRMMKRAPNRLASVVDHVVRYRDFDLCNNSPFCFSWDPFDPFGNRGSLEGVADVKIISPRKVRALLLVEPPSYGHSCHVRLYTETDRPRIPSRSVGSNPAFGKVFAKYC